MRTVMSSEGQIVGRAAKQRRASRDKVFSRLRHAAFLVACLGTLCSSVDARIPAPKRPPAGPRVVPENREPHPWIPLGKETSYLTGPVDEDGYVDYLAALNAAASEGVTAENNAAVLLVRTMDFSSVPASERDRLFKMLKVEPPRTTEGCFQDSSAFLANQGDQFGETVPSTMVPWSADEFRPRAKWLQRHEQALDLAIEATRRSRCYFPLIMPADAEMSFDLPLYGLQQSNEIGRALTARALLRIHDGNIAEAEQDLLACHRLARLVGSGLFLLNGAVGRAIEVKACLSEAALLQSGKLSAADAAAYRAELQKLPPLPSVAHQLGHGDRMLFLAFATELAHKQQPELEEMTLSLAPYASPDFLVPLLTDQMTVIWQSGMRTMNKEWDRWVAAVGTPIASGRRQQLEKLEAEARPLLKDKADAVSEAPLKERGRWMGRMLTARLMPAIKTYAVIEDRTQMRVDLIKLGLALAAHHADWGSYPSTLEALVPKYCSEVPADRFTAKPLIYRLQSDGYVLYSTGENGVDDGGHGYDVKPYGDDIVIQVGNPDPTSLSSGTSGRWMQSAAILLAVATLGLTIVGVRLTRRPRPRSGGS
jgi:hypothetical protein